MLKLIKQLVKFGFVGGLCFVIDYLLMILFTEVGQFHYLLSCALAFIVSTVVNYLLSMRYVFLSKNNTSKSLEFILFFVMSVIGLLLTEALMHFAVESLSVHYMLSKVIVTAIVMIYNFVTRKLLFEKHSNRKESGDEE